MLVGQFGADDLRFAIMVFSFVDLLRFFEHGAEAFVHQPDQALRFVIVHGRRRERVQEGERGLVVAQRRGLLAVVWKIWIAEDVAGFEITDRERLLRRDVARVCVGDQFENGERAFGIRDCAGQIAPGGLHLAHFSSITSTWRRMRASFGFFARSCSAIRFVF